MSTEKAFGFAVFLLILMGFLAHSIFKSSVRGNQTEVNEIVTYDFNAVTVSKFEYEGRTYLLTKGCILEVR